MGGFGVALYPIALRTPTSWVGGGGGGGGGSGEVPVLGVLRYTRFVWVGGG